MTRFPRSSAVSGPPDPMPLRRAGRRRHLARRLSLLLPVGLLVAALGACESAPPPAPPVAPEEVPRAALTFPEGWNHPADALPVTGRGGAVSTTDALATAVGIRILEAGGTAMDAAIAVSFALAVVNPEAGNLGGGGFMVTRLADGTITALDYREKAPLAATRDMYLDEEGNLTDRSVIGHLSAGVPGTVMGMWEAHQRHGTLPWILLLEPAIELAGGFEVTERLVRSLRGSRARLSRFETTRETFLPGGEPPELGSLFRQPDLAATLRRIRDAGPAGFYEGQTADLIVAEMARGGGIITHLDLERYEARWRDPVSFTFRGHRIHSMPPSSSGGPTMALMAHMLEAHDLQALGWLSADYVHLFAEAARRAYADRNEVLADPDFVEVPLARMISTAYARERGADIDLARATPSAEVGPGLVVGEPTETTHFSIVDAEGNAVAVTTTINSSYGSGVTVAGAGFLLNNEMDDFAARPGTPNQFGLVQGEQNAIEPGKRMLSAMSPTIVETPEGELLLVTGTPGGSTIITTVLQTVLGVVEFGMSVAQAVNAPRVHHQHLPDQIQFERGGLPEAVVADLEARGHVVRERGGTSGDVHAILRLPDGTLTAYADPRLGGQARARP